MELYKYQGAGNDFIIVDNRNGGFHPTTAEISALCDRHYGIGADGLMLLEEDPAHDFRMVYYNSDGSGGMMCGNGGRCITAFAADMGITPANGCRYLFLADDGPHSAEILSPKPAPTDRLRPEILTGPTRTVRLKMLDVDKINNIDVKSYYLNTGTRHFVKFVSGLESYDVIREGRIIRNLPQFAPIGTNVNFVEPDGDILRVRTYEKGVEDETLACGTGITASAIAATRHYSLEPERRTDTGRAIRHAGNRTFVEIKAVHDTLAVDFIETRNGAEDVWLTGPAAFVFKITLSER